MESKVGELEVNAQCLIEYTDVIIVKSDDPNIEDEPVEVQGYHIAEFSRGEYVGKKEDLLKFPAMKREKLRYEFWPILQKIIEQAKTEGVLSTDFNSDA